MKCSINDCPGAYDHKLVPHTVRPGGKLIVIDDVPALVCDTCGDVLFEPDTIEQIEQVLQDGGRSSTSDRQDNSCAEVARDHPIG